MKAKRKTAAQRQAEERAALRQRICDIGLGATYGEADSEDYFFGAEELERFVTALKRTFSSGYSNRDEDPRFMSHNIGSFGTIDKATDFLFEDGVRA